VLEIIRQYSRYFIGPDYEDTFAQGLLALEQNWEGPLLGNAGVDLTLAQFQSMERAASPQVMLNWRFLEHLYRAYYDAYTRHRLIYETAAEHRAVIELRRAGSRGSLAAVATSEKELDDPAFRDVGAEWRSRIFELAEALYQGIRMQFSVEKYKANAPRRSATLDSIDFPLNDRDWLKQNFEGIRKAPTESSRREMIDQLLDRDNPGPGGFYDQLGNPLRRPHLVGATRDVAKDPMLRDGPRTGWQLYPQQQPALPYWWRAHAEVLYDKSLQMRYEDLDPKARYRLRVVYGGDASSGKLAPVSLRLVANERFVVHDYVEKIYRLKPVEFDIPAEETRDGNLVLTWSCKPGVGGLGRVIEISEVFLIRVSR
jgi:hypothetical protein